MQRQRRHTKATLLVVDELGYLRYDNHLADLLYEVISRRYDLRRRGLDDHHHEQALQRVERGL